MGRRKFRAASIWSLYPVVMGLWTKFRIRFDQLLDLVDEKSAHNVGLVVWRRLGYQRIKLQRVAGGALIYVLDGRHVRSRACFGVPLLHLLRFRSRNQHRLLAGRLHDGNGVRPGFVDPGRPVTILASHLDRPVRPAQRGLQVSMMVEVHRPRIELPLTQRQELRMLVVKIRHVGIELQLSLFDVQIGVALSTTGICRFGHPGLSLDAQGGTNCRQE